MVSIPLRRPSVSKKPYRYTYQGVSMLGEVPEEEDFDFPPGVWRKIERTYQGVSMLGEVPEEEDFDFPPGVWQKIKKCTCKERGKPKQRRKRSKCTRRNHRAKTLINHARQRAEKKNLAFDLDKYEEEIQKRIDKGFCELTGVALCLSGGIAFNTPSLDRIVPDRGYILSNVRIVCLCINQALGDWGESVLRTVISEWLERENEK